MPSAARGGLQRERPQRLPPLEPACSIWDDETMDLLGHSMAELASFEGTSAAATSPSGGALAERRLCAISCFGHRANERAAEAVVEIAAHDRVVNDGTQHRGTVTSGFSAEQLAEKQQQAFERVVARINAALAGDGGSPAKTLRKDEQVSETVPLHGSRQYRVPLPSRPVAVVVTLKVTAGPRCALWGSTSCERPSVRNFDWKGKDDKLMYEHVSKEDDDMRGQVPSTRDLWVSVEAEAGEASYRISVSMAPVKMTLSRAEIASRVKKMRRGWEAKLEELHKDPAARHDFEDRVRQLRQEKKARVHDQSHGVDYLEKNTKLKDYRDHRDETLHRQAELSKARRLKATEIKEELERRQESENLAWLQRGELRRQERELQELEDRAREERIERQRQWLVRCVLAGFLARTGEQYRANHESFELELRERGAEGVLRRFFLRYAARRRRANLYNNVIRLRTGLATYVRIMQPAVCANGVNIVRRFLDTYKFNKESPSLAGTLRSFRAKVVRVQRFFKRTLLVRSAFVQLFSQDWKTHLARLLDKRVAVEEQLWEQEEAKAMEALKTVEGNPKAQIRMREKPNYRELIEKDMPPLRMARIWLFDYVREMQLTYRDRLQKWEEAMQQEAVRQDLAKFGVDAGAVKQAGGSQLDAKPRPIYKDEASLEALVETRLAEWLGNGHQHEKANRHRLLSVTFDQWEHVVRAQKLNVDPEDLPRKRRGGRARRVSPNPAGRARPPRKAKRPSSTLGAAAAVPITQAAEFAGEMLLGGGGKGSSSDLGEEAASEDGGGGGGGPEALS